MKKKLIFGTCLPRSGGALVSNLLTSHKKILITIDLFHFYRFSIGKYQPIKKFSDTKDYKKYIKYLRIINKEYILLKKAEANEIKKIT